MQTRERRLLIVTLLVVACWPLDALVIRPAMAWYDQLAAERRQLRLANTEAAVVIEHSRQIMRAWQQQHNAGLLDGEDEAGYRLHQIIDRAASGAGVRVAALGGARLRPADQDSAFATVQVSLRSEGTIAATRAFLRRLGMAESALRIERCELLAREVTGDLIDCSLTISTCIVVGPARDERHLAPKTGSWQPTARGELAARINGLFKPKRQDAQAQPTPPPVSEPTEPQPAPPTTPSVVASWTLVGLVCPTDGGSPQAFLRHQQSGEERILLPGETIDDHTIAAIDSSGIQLADSGDDQPQTITPGLDLLGRRQGAAISATGAVTSETAGSTGDHSKTTTSPFTTPARPTSADQQAILERLRQQRMRQRN